ncbi:putative ammonium transporter 3 [Mercenaria mercenaria]|uniref:putative ammonium transporter 3 n=1 Tax=Mercenaria mercenaria TaxID=6596 RepID=UPI00234E5332|nr:putative ammonium transporter 3 [Mercenaria mercenaria]
MVKNAVDVVFGGITYWAFGFGLSFGNSPGTNPFCGVGYFFVDASQSDMGIIFSTYVFQLSFATTATTIVSGAMAERTKLLSYIVFSFLNTIVYCIPAHWEWASNGFLRTLGVVDIAGSGAVHLVGGVSAFVATFLLKPRHGRYREGQKATENPLPMGNPTNALIGMFMLWWGWLAFNCGSTFGISGGKWKLAAKAAITTLNGSMGGGIIGILFSYVIKKGVFDVGYLVNSILGALVGITACCAVVKPWEAVIIGLIGGILAIMSAILINKIKMDDPVGAIAVHGVCGMWGMLAVGLFGAHDPLENTTQGRDGLFHGGGMYLLGVQTLACFVIIAWSAVVSGVLLLGIKFTIGLRLSEENEIIGADYVEHGIGTPTILNYSDRGLLSPPARSRTPSVCSAVTTTSIKSMTETCNDDINLLSRLRTKRFRSDKVVPLGNIPGEVQNNFSSPVDNL